MKKGTDNFAIPDQVVLYGAASIASILTPKFEENGIRVVGYIDKRAEEIGQLFGRPVWSVSDPSLKGYRNDSYFIFVSVKNVFEHTDIANILIDIGFQNIVYRPRLILEGGSDPALEAIYQAYDAMEKGKAQKGVPIPKTREHELPKITDGAVVCRDTGCVTALLPIELLHTDIKVPDDIWYDKSILSLVPHIDFFRFLLNDAGHYTAERYLDFCIESGKASKIEITDRWKKNVLHNRAMVFEQMRRAMELDPGFFIRNAPIVYWNRCGYFNLDSGKHRGAFYVSMHRRYMPVNMREEDYSHWKNAPVLEEVSAYMKEHGIYKLKAPISHPCFIKYPCDSTSFYYDLLGTLIYLIADRQMYAYGKTDFAKEHIFVYLDDSHFIGRAFAQMHADVEAIDEGGRLAGLIDQLLRCTVKNVSWAETEHKNYTWCIVDVRKKGAEKIAHIHAENYMVITDKRKYVDKGDSNLCIFAIIEGKETTACYVKTWDVLKEYVI